MLRRVLVGAVFLLIPYMFTAQAQYAGSMGGQPGSSDFSQQMDCSQPQNALSPACSGVSSQPMSPSGAVPGVMPAQGYGQSTYGPAYGAPGYPQQYGSVPGNGSVPGSGINQRVPTFVDQVPYGRGIAGAYRTPYSPYTRNTYQPTEFQRVVAGATGAMLPIFGADLFAENGGSFVPVDRVPVTPDYVIGPGDQLLIRIWGQVNFNAHSTVDRAGDIYVPQVGNIEVAGLHFQQLDGYLKQQLGRVYKNFDLSVNVGQVRSIQVYVVGYAQRPGSYTLSALSTLVNALFSSGGPSPQGSMRNIQLKRSGKVVTTLDLYDLLIFGDKTHDAPLLPGDVIYIPPVGPQVALAGSVNTPAIYELKGLETVGDLIAMAGGLTAMAAKNDAQLDRTDRAGNRRTVLLSLNAEGLKTVMRNGDILRIPSIVQRFDNTVTLRGNVANPGRYSWKPGMRILDLIPDAASLETRGYWQRRIALGLPAPEYTPLLSVAPTTPALPNGLQLPEGMSRQAGRSASSASVAGSETQAQANAAALAAQAQSISPGTEAANGTPATQSVPGTGKTQNNAASTAITSQLMREFPAGNRFSEAVFPVHNEILRIAPSIDWSYAAIQRTNPHTLASSIIPFNLGQAVLDHNPSQNLLLEPGDIVTIFSTADIKVPQGQQTKYVELEGEIVHAGIYSVKPGETLRDLVRRAGGLTPNAYLYGSEFLRLSTQRLQQARLDEYTNSLERDLQISATNAPGSLVNPNGTAALTTSAQAQRALVTTLRSMRATGRIVLDVTPFSRGVDAIPNIELQDGDRFIVPATPVTVNVVGAVYDQNSFLYHRGDHVGDYLRISGGGTRNADKRHEFVIRADGSVVSKQTSGGTVFGGGFDGKLVYPGDTIVVPDNINKTTVLRGLTDWSAVFSQFGLGIASLTLLGL
jgi:polysaccharide export outer membrane protein